MGIFRQFPYTNFHEMNLSEVINILLTMQEEWNATKAEWASYKEFIDNYFENLDLTEEVYKVMLRMAANGELADIVDPVIIDWLIDNITPTKPLVDGSLRIPGAAADAKATGDGLKHKVNIPLDANNQPTYGNSGQLLRSKGVNATEWVDPGTPSKAQVDAAVSAWLDNHPEAVTTVTDGSITINKLNSALKMLIDYTYYTISDMIADTNIEEGMIVSTLSAYVEGDGYGEMYLVKSSLDETKAYEILANGLYAYPMLDALDFHADNRIFNSDDAVSIIADTALTYSKYTTGSGTDVDPYVSTVFAYGGNDNWSLDTPPVQDGDGKWEIRCSAFVKDLIFGVTYENSAYLNASNRFDNRLCIDKYASLLDKDDQHHDTRWLALYAYMHGYAFFPNADYSNIRPGDVLFYDNGDGSPHTDRFMGTNHCAVFAYRINNNMHAVWETGGLPVLQRQTDNYFNNYLVMCARFPYNDNGSAEKVNLLQSPIPEITASTQTVVTVPCSKTLKAYKQYTAVVKLDMGTNDINDFFPNIRDTNGNTISLTYSGATLKPIDDVYVIPFIPVTDITSVRLYLAARTGGLTLDSVTLEWMNVFEGLVTNCDQYVPPVVKAPDLNISQHAISPSDDLNDYVVPGSYTCAGSGVAATLSNCPLTTAGFRLDVMEINTGKQVQILYSDGTDAGIYYRRNNVGSSIFGTWLAVTMA